MPFQNKFSTKRKYSESNSQFFPNVQCRYIVALDEKTTDKISNYSSQKNPTLVFEELPMEINPINMEEEENGT